MYFYGGDNGNDDEEKKRAERQNFDLFGFDDGGAPERGNMPAPPPQYPPQYPPPQYQPPYNGGGNYNGGAAVKSNKGLKILCIVLTVIVVVSNIITIIVAMNLSKKGKTQYVTNDVDMLSKVVAANTIDQVALITITMPNARMFGSGYVVHATLGTAYIMTNAHVVTDILTVSGSNITQSRNANIGAVIDGGSYNNGTVLAIDRGRDMAIFSLKTGLITLNAVTFGNSDALTYGDFVQVEGNPYGDGLTVTPGTVSAIRKNLALSGSTGIGATPQTIIQTNAAINPGNSGGPLYDKDGKLVGMNTAKMKAGINDEVEPEGIGYSIAGSEVIAFINNSRLGFTVEVSKAAA